MTVYLDCNATTPIEPEVRDLVLHYMAQEYGNAGSRTHDFGGRAQRAVQRARDQIAEVVKAKRDEVVFTSGATESNNLALLGLSTHGERSGRRHIVSTAIEHKAVLEPVSVLAARGFEVTLVRPTPGGWVDAQAVRDAVRVDTLLVSVMHVNNETGVAQPVAEIADLLGGHDAFLHVDAAQGFGKDLPPLWHPRIDLISASGHKLYAPKGVGALIVRRRAYKRAPLAPLMFGGGQERRLRPGTLAVPLIAGFGLSAALALRDAQSRAVACRRFREEALAALLPLGPVIHGDPARTLPHVLNLSIPGVDSEALMLAWKGQIAMSNGAACTSQTYSQSHVLSAMLVPGAAIQGAVRLSWCHLTEPPRWDILVDSIRRLVDHGPSARTNSS